MSKLSRRLALQSFGAMGFGLSQGLSGPVWANVLPRKPLEFKVAAQSESAQPVAPSKVVLNGWLGHRLMMNATHRLMNIDIEPILEGFIHKPGSHPWIGEHIGKYIHAASLAWANSGDTHLKAKLDQTVKALIATQEGDGYLGTYLPEDRFAMAKEAEWDVWSHKYCMMGLLTYYQYTGYAPALEASQKAADLLIRTFPAQRSILAAGPHTGMAPSSVLEPIVLLYRLTGEKRYLDFAFYITTAWQEAGGPDIVRTLLKTKKVRQVGNAKAYEMLSNIVGMAHLGMLTGDQSFIHAAQNAWQDVVDTQLFASGTTSRWEYFQADFDYRDDPMSHVGETCVSVTWIQLNQALLQITGEARYGHELERTYYNALTAAQNPQGDDWCYFTPLNGRKHYDKHITCCHSSGPRGLAMAVMSAFYTQRIQGEDVVLINSFETSSAELNLGGQKVILTQTSAFPYEGRSQITVSMDKPAIFGLRVRVPEWAAPMKIKGAVMREGWAHIAARQWRDGDKIDLAYNLNSYQKAGVPPYNQGRIALFWGPYLLAYEQNKGADLPPAYRLAYAGMASLKAPTKAGPLRFTAKVSSKGVPAQTVELCPYADAGVDAGIYRTWLRASDKETPPADSVLLDASESRSRKGHLSGSINDEDHETLVSTYDGYYSDEDWFAITSPTRLSAKRFVFMHGRNYHHGGWFDTSATKPRFEVQKEPDGPWEPIGALEKYPATTAYDAGMLKQPWMGYEFTLELPERVDFYAVRVIGKPSSGDEPNQAFATCTQLQAFKV